MTAPAAAAAQPPMLSLRHVTKRYPFTTGTGESASASASPGTVSAPSSGTAQRAAVQDVSLEVARGEVLSLLGPSGCGKTTLLRMVAGLEQPDKGQILLEGADLAGVPVHRRGFGLMFQEFALFPDKSVAQNVAFGLRMAGWERTAIQRRVGEMLALVGLQGYDERTIFALSGGERQRVALARSLAPSPRLLMLDEPLGSLDRVLREGLLEELRRILKRVGITALYVTHDQQEALAVSDRVAVLRAGQLLQVGTPPELHARPADAFVARFLGLTNLLPAMVEAAAPQMARTSLGPLPLADPSTAGDWMLLIRPSALLSAAQAAQRGLPTFSGRVTEASFRGTFVRTEIEVPPPAEATGGRSAAPVLLSFDLPPGAAPAAGSSVTFALDPAGCQVVQP